jgi:putative aldouronate transport system substrate-binding protein
MSKWTMGKKSGLAVLAVCIVAGCSSKETPAAEGTTGKEDTTPTKITIMTSLNTSEVPSETLKKLLEEKTNTQLTINFSPGGSYEEKFQAALATETLAPITYVGNQAGFIKTRNAIKNNQFWEIGPYLKDYPNLSKLDQEILNNMKVDGKIYALYQEVPRARSGIIYRKDWADKLGLAAPTSIDDIYNMLKKFKESGLAAIPLADRNEFLYGAFKTLSSYFGTPNSWGLVDGGLVPDFTTQGYMDTMKFMKKLRDEGLINKDFPVTSKTDQQNLMYSGKSGMYIGSISDVNSMSEKTEANFKEAKFDVENRIVGTNGKTGVWAVHGYGNAVLFPKSAVKNEAELKKLLAFCDKLFDPEIANLLMHGVEGTHYSLQDSKVLPVTDAKLLEKDVSGYGVIALARITNIKPKVFTRPATEKAEQLINEAVKFSISDPTAPLDSATYTERGARLQDIIKDATYKFMLGDIDEKGFQDAVKKWKDQGGSSMIEEYNASYKLANKK